MGKSRYNNKKVEKYGQKWDSEMELDYYEGVCLPKLKSGEFKEVKTQVEFVLQDKFEYKGKKIQPIRYKADFVITTKENTQIVVDVKGVATTEFKLKWKMMKFKYQSYEYLCIQGRGRDKRKGIMHYRDWIPAKGVV